MIWRLTQFGIGKSRAAIQGQILAANCRLLLQVRITSVLQKLGFPALYISTGIDHFEKKGKDTESSLGSEYVQKYLHKLLMNMLPRSLESDGE